MKFGILFTSHPDPKSESYPHQSIHERVTREIIEAEELGYDSIWIAEHHFSNRYGIMPDPFAYLSYLAAKTNRIKLGAAVMVVPLHHPLRIVENAAFVDILSNGRFQLGLGSGYRPYEFEGLGIDFETRRERQSEAIDLILEGFHEKRVNANGKFFKFKMDEAFEIFPQPIQQPHPPFFMGAGTNNSMQLAAHKGFGLMQGTLPSFEILSRNIEFYKDKMKAAPAPLNKNPAFGQFDVVRMVYVAPSDAKAKEESEAGITYHMKTFLSGDTGGYLGDVAEKDSESEFAYDNLTSTTILHGSPDTVTRRIKELQVMGVTSLMLHYPPYYETEQTLNMLRLFAKEVMPHVQS